MYAPSSPSCCYPHQGSLHLEAQENHVLVLLDGFTTYPSLSNTLLPAAWFGSLYKWHPTIHFFYDLTLFHHCFLDLSALIPTPIQNSATWAFRCLHVCPPFPGTCVDSGFCYHKHHYEHGSQQVPAGVCIVVLRFEHKQYHLEGLLKRRWQTHPRSS